MRTLEELRTQNWPAPELDAVRNVLAETPGCPEWLIPEVVLDHLSHFVPGDCPRCGAYASAGWALVHGCTECVKCGYPGRAYHFFTNPEDDTQSFRLVSWLWAHPNEVSVAQPD